MSALHGFGNGGFVFQYADHLDIRLISDRGEHQLSHQPRSICYQNFDTPQTSGLAAILREVRQKKRFKLVLAETNRISTKHVLSVTHQKYLRSGAEVLERYLGVLGLREE